MWRECYLIGIFLLEDTFYALVKIFDNNYIAFCGEERFCSHPVVLQYIPDSMPRKTHRSTQGTIFSAKD